MANSFFGRSTPLSGVFFRPTVARLSKQILYYYLYGLNMCMRFGQLAKLWLRVVSYWFSEVVFLLLQNVERSLFRNYR